METMTNIHPMKVLILGATGMLARPVIRELGRAGFSLRLFSRTIDPLFFPEIYEVMRGDVMDPVDLDRAMSGCDAVHVSLAHVDESLAMKNIIDVAWQKGIKLISYVSGSTVAKRNQWFPMIDHKYRAEQVLFRSGIPYLVFRPSWFFEILPLMVRDGKAMQLGKQPHPSHWVAADDYARMVVAAYRDPDTWNRVYVIHGPEHARMKDLLEKYCRQHHPEIRKVNVIPIGMAKVIATLAGNRDLKEAAALFSYFEKVQEMGDPQEANTILGKPEIHFDQWVLSAS